VFAVADQTLRAAGWVAGIVKRRHTIRPETSKELA
jgi:hypothetical protein